MANGGGKRTTIADPQAQVREGRRLFLESSCMTCHSVGSRGGTSAPALDGIGKRRAKRFIEAKIRDPQAHPNLKRKSKMIQSDLFDNEIKSLAAYLMTLPAEQRKNSGRH